jgi:hypothetical protein
MFPDLQIAQKFCYKRTKVTNIVNNALFRTYDSQVTLLCKENRGNLCGKIVSSLISCNLNAKCDCFELRPSNDLCITAKGASLQD